ncbi:uncharacterized protein [Ptychodera flava]|uniref:uncharacterized protein n=1 Tax=Ptychodera flava TaxID=63121 RepID=UPI003969C610
MRSQNLTATQTRRHLGLAGTRWLTSFELYADGKGLILDENASAATKQRRRALLLNLASPDVQDIFSTLSNTGTATEYSEAVTALNTYFVPQVNPAFARQTFHQVVQKQGETVLQFVTRLRKAAKDCNFGVDNDNQIRDAVLNKCLSDYVCWKLMEEGTGLTLTCTLQIADQCEKVEVQMAALSVKRLDTETINRLTEKNGHPHRPKKRGKDIETRAWKEKTCYRCGSTGHFGHDPKCPAKGQTCRKCSGKNHFAKACRSKETKTKSRVNAVEEPQDTSKHDYFFTVHGKGNSNMLDINIGGVKLQMLVDSGATSNIIDERTWERLKSEWIKCISQAASVNRKLYPYGSEKPLSVKGTFTGGCESR